MYEQALLGWRGSGTGAHQTASIQASRRDRTSAAYANNTSDAQTSASLSMMPSMSSRVCTAAEEREEMSSERAQRAEFRPAMHLLSKHY
jgi:hypothetical protein